MTKPTPITDAATVRVGSVHDDCFYVPVETSRKLEHLSDQLYTALDALRDRYVPNDDARPEVAAADAALKAYRECV